MSVGNDGMSNCDRLCNPENHYEWSCKHYCPGYVYTPTSSSMPTTTTAFSTDTKGSSQSSVLMIVSVSVAALAIVFALFCILYKLKNRKKKDETIGRGIQETGNTSDTLVRHENELNDQREQLETLIEHGQSEENNCNGTNNAVESTATGPAETHRVLNGAINSNHRDNVSRTTESTWSSETICSAEKPNQEQAVDHCNICGTVKSEGQTEVVVDMDVASSEDVESVKEESSDEEEIDYVIIEVKV